MPAIALQSPLAQFFDLNGRPLSDGELYFGTENQNPLTSPVTVYWDEAMLIPAVQPILTRAGYPYRSGTPAAVYLPGNVSMLVRDKQGQQVGYFASSTEFINSANILDRLDSEVVSTDGIGMVGLGPSLSYPVGSAGHWVTKVLTDFHVFKWIPAAQWAAILNGTSTYDASSAWASAINAAKASGRPARVTCATGKYHFDNVIGSFTDLSNITIDFADSTLDAADVQTAVFDRFLYISGTYGATSVLTSNAADLTQTLDVNSSGFAANDWVRIYSSTVWDSTRTSTKIGEINQIDTVPNGASVTLVTPCQSAYTTAATATMQKLSMCRNVHIRNGTLIGPAANDQLGGIELVLGLECSITRMNSRDFDNRHFRFVDCVLSEIAHNNFEEAIENSQAYAISFADATQDCQAHHNTMRNVRHAFTTNNNTSTSYGIARRNQVAYNRVYNNIPNDGGTSGDALDTHAGSEDITFEHNEVFNAYGIGINVEGRSAVVHGNKIYGSTASGMRLVSYVDGEDAEYQVTDNEVVNAGDGSSSDYGLFMTTVVAGIKRLVMTGNKVQSVNNALELQGVSGKTIKNFTITGNHFEVWDTGPGTIGNWGANVDFVQYGTFAGNWFSGPLRGIEISDSDNVSVSGNYAQITGTSGSLGRAIALVDCDYVSVSSNTVRYTTTGITTTVGCIANATSTYCGFWNNVTQGFGSAVNNGGGTGSVSANNI